MWGFEHFDVVPDIITVAKGIASGMPVSAVVSDKAIMDKWAPGAHGGTYGGNAVGTAAAAATLQVMREERLAENAAAMGSGLMHGLRAIQGRLSGHRRSARSGTDDRGGVRQSGRRSESGGRCTVIQTCLEERVLLIKCGTYDQAIRIIPPLVVNAAEIDHFLDIFGRAVASL